MIIWADGELSSPVSGLALAADTPHSLAAEGERWPVLDSIPFLRADRRALADAALAALDGGDRESALVALLGDQDTWARTPPPDEAARRALVRDAAQLTFRDAMDRLAFGPVAAYFAHRWSDPTFLSGLALAEAHMAPGPVFELACGAGHFLAEFARMSESVSGGDLVFAKLWLARHWLAPAARLVCFDAAASWPLRSNSAATVFCHDALYFLPDKPHVAAEMRRVAGPNGAVLVGHAHNALVDNLSAGEPLPPAGYVDLFAAPLFAAPLLYDDRELTAALIEARAPVPAEAEALADAPAVAVVSNTELPQPVAGALALPLPGTKLRRNPLYAGDRIAWPSERYEREYGPLATYPAHPEGPEHALAGADPATDDLARRRVLVALPDRW